MFNLQTKQLINFFSPHQFNFPSVGSFCFNEIDIHFPNKKDQSEFESIKRNHANIIVGLLSEANLNDPTDIFTRLAHITSVLRELDTRFAKLDERYLGTSISWSIYGVLKIMRNTTHFVHYVLRCLFWSQFPYSGDFSSIETMNEIEKLEDLLRDLDLSNENQTIAFHNYKIKKTFEQNIVKVSNFTLNRYSKLIYDFRSTSTMYYDVVLPFHDKNYDETSTDCTRARDLPTFYRQKK